MNIWRIITDDTVAYDMDNNHTLYIRRVKNGITLKLIQFTNSNEKMVLYVKSIDDKQLGFTFGDKKDA